MIDTGSSELNTKWKNVLHNSDDDYIIPESNVNVVCPYDCLDMSGNMYSTQGYIVPTYCDISKIKNAPTNLVRNKKIATFEWNLWVLDGSFDVLDDNEVFNGYMSTTYSGEDCSFLISPYCIVNRTDGGTFSLRKNQTIKFNPLASECPAFINIQSRYGTDNGTVTLNNIDFNIEEMLEDEELNEREYVNLFSDDIDTTDTNTQICITCTKTLMPYRRFRISEYNNGYKFFKDKYDLLSFTHTRSVSLCMDELPQNDLQISFTDLEGLFDSQRSDSPFKIAFNSSHRFYVYYGYNFDDIGWNYVFVDTLAMNELEINRESVETVLSMQSTLQLCNNKYNCSKLDWKNTAQTSPYNWTSFRGFMSAIKDQLSESFNIDYDTNGTISYLDTSLSKWQYYLYYSYRCEQEFNTIPLKELIQQICAFLRCALVRQPNGDLFFENLYAPTITVYDSVEAVNVLSYPTKTEGEHYKKVVIDTPKTSNDQNDDEANNVSEGSLHWYYLKSRETFTISAESSSVTDEATISQKIIPLSFAQNHNDCWNWSAGIWQNYANHYWLVKKSTRYEFGEVMLNPLLQVADPIYLYLGDNYERYTGRIEKIEINYDGSFKGALTVCSFN